MLKQPISGHAFRIRHRSILSHSMNTPEIAPDTAAGLPASSAPEVAPAENAQTGDGKDTSALFSAAQDDENIAILIDENMTLRAQVEILEKDLLAASEALDNVLTARTVITTDEAGNSLETALPEEDVVIEEADDLTPEAANQQALVYRPVTTTDDQIAEPQQPAIDVTLPAYENTMEAEAILPEGSMQIQLASYTSMEKAQLGIATLQQEIPDEFEDISFMIKNSDTGFRQGCLPHHQHAHRHGNSQNHLLAFLVDAIWLYYQDGRKYLEPMAQ